MKKLFNIFLIFALIIATFDVIDANDITLCDNPIFAGDVTPMDDDKDDIQDHYNSVVSFKLVFNLPKIEAISFSHEIIFQKNNLRSISPNLYNEYSSSLYRPPIV